MKDKKHTTILHLWGKKTNSVDETGVLFLIVTKRTLYITHHFPYFWPCSSFQRQANALTIKYHVKTCLASFADMQDKQETYQEMRYPNVTWLYFATPLAFNAPD